MHEYYSLIRWLSRQHTDRSVCFGLLVRRCNAVSDTTATPKEKGQINIGSLDQLGVSLPSTALATTPRGSTVDTEQVLGWISPVKRLEPKTMPPKSICFNLDRIPLCCRANNLTLCHKLHHMKPSSLRRNIYVMLTRDVLLCRFRKMMLHRDRQVVAHSYLLCTLDGTYCLCLWILCVEYMHLHVNSFSDIVS